MNNLAISKSSVKLIGSNGQISLGKEFAGRQVLVEEREPGVWLIRTARIIPDNESWLHEPKASKDLKRALMIAANSTQNESIDLDALKRKIDINDKGNP